MGTGPTKPSINQSTAKHCIVFDQESFSISDDRSMNTSSAS